MNGSLFLYTYWSAVLLISNTASTRHIQNYLFFIYVGLNRCVGVPIFVWMIFASELTPTLEALFLNRIDPLGDSATLQQVYRLFILRPCTYCTAL